ncbi:hypothetical protein SERLA73DRAFT_144632 [Serpula lacrymans var. lacrymans S7.3]|uniref:Uncharacterized protein n=2 Tax=Serpula lacrymans var. lacrymans TaxID=341189 RepID=F8QC50_SERL3|nr:uncharacterized protein SERLADRAFT_402092 [Serpula lacrymans var. lacrymans S7.9]EGN94169.1 hypothetical protein SERLA73DRAFT_144632 [Serpula lacrymans var. lacrymans S7.3]EGO19596.1 hypothetical protein SERLADRAFT_402092 [Serpula lacrymans var. lacrymans S7.9]
MLMKDRIHRKEKELKTTYAKIKAFQGPPPVHLQSNLKLMDTRHFQLRGQLLVRMADGVS